MKQEKTYKALLSRIVLSYAHLDESVKALERQPDLNESEKKIIIERKAVADHLKRIIEVEQSEDIMNDLQWDDYMRMAQNIYEAALDMDFGDYIDSREEDINRLATALQELDPHDMNAGILLQALERIYNN